MKYIILFSLFLIQTSCMSILGYRQDKTLSDKKIVKLAKRFNVPLNQLYKIDPKIFTTLIKSKELTEKDRQNMEQPIQVLIFDSEDKNVTNLIDCNIGGFPILKWNVFKGMDSIPIRQGFFRTTPEFFSKAELDILIIPLFDPNSAQHIKNPRYYYYILWSRVLFRNSKKFIKIIKNHAKLAKAMNIPIDIKYIFSDSMYD